MMLTTHFETLHVGRRLRVARLGAGPTVVLLHGYPENLQIWCALAPRLAKHFEVIAFDWPGMGYSDAWPGGAAPEHQANRLLEILDHLHIARASVIGMDMGGQPLLVFAAQHPDRIESLVVMNSLVFGDEQTSWEIALLRKFGFNRWILRNLARPVFWRAERTFLPRGVRLPAELRADFWNAFQQRRVRKFISKMCAGYQGFLPSLPDIYAGVHCPTLVLWGGLDRHFPVCHAQRLHEAIPGSQLEVLPDGEHWMAWHTADEIAERIERFLAPHL